MGIKTNAERIKMNVITKMSTNERKEEFEKFLKDQVKSASRYICDLERGFDEAPIAGYDSIYEISDLQLLENAEKTKALRESTVFTRNSVGGTAGLAGLNWYIRFLKDGRDSYYDFMNYFHVKPKDLFAWGMEATIFPKVEAVEDEWEDLKRRVFHNEAVSIRGYGRDAHGTDLYINFYKYIFKNEHIKKDPSNNTSPQRIIKKVTGYTRNKDIYNFQVSHIWGHTKNVLLFEAPWNICYTPKIIDPFTGHETKGDLPEEFQKYFRNYAQKKYRKFIDDYNTIIHRYDIQRYLLEYCNKEGIDDERFVNEALAELSEIIIE